MDTKRYLKRQLRNAPADSISDQLAELARNEDAISDLLAPGLRIEAGPFRLARKWDSHAMAKVVLSLHVGLWLLGAASIVFGQLSTSALGGAATELGIAVVVGATFGIGTFLTELWSQATDHEQELLVPELQQQFAELRRRQEDLIRELRQNNQTVGTDNNQADGAMYD